MLLHSGSVRRDAPVENVHYFPKSSVEFGMFAQQRQYQRQQQPKMCAHGFVQTVRGCIVEMVNAQNIQQVINHVGERLSFLVNIA